MKILLAIELLATSPSAQDRKIIFRHCECEARGNPVKMLRYFWIATAYALYIRIASLRVALPKIHLLRV